MLARIRKSAEQKDSGFTLIELLVVMIIIGILAAIAIPAFLSQKNKAKATSAKADVTTIGKEISAFFVDNPKITTALTVSTPAPAAAADPVLWSFDGTTPAITGKLSSDNVANGKVNTDGSWCVWVYNSSVDKTETAAKLATAETSWKYDANGLAKGACA